DQASSGIAGRQCEARANTREALGRAREARILGASAIAAYSRDIRQPADHGYTQGREGLGQSFRQRGFRVATGRCDRDRPAFRSGRRPARAPRQEWGQGFFAVVPPSCADAERRLLSRRERGFAGSSSTASEVAFALLALHRALVVMIDGATLPLGER